MTGETTLSSISPGTRWNDLEIIRKLGQGGTCAVYLARDSLGNETALKVLFPSQNTLRFKREFRSMLKLQHPNIVKVHDYGEYRDYVYFTMDYIDGGDLRSYIRSGTALPEQIPGQKSENRFRDVAETFLRICEPLQYIHDLRIVHRDLKPANIMVTSAGEIQLMDFGLIKEMDLIQETITRTGTIVGTVAYMSPEQGMGKSLDHRSDLYSLGIILYEALTGRLPFTGTNVIQILMQHVNKPPTSPSAIDSDIPRELEHLALRLLNKLPSARPPSIHAVKEILACYLNPDSRTVELDQTMVSDLIEMTRTDERIVRSGLLAPGLVGRTEETGKINSLLDACRENSAGIVMVQGETGIGKSVLIQDCTASARLNGFNVLESACLEVEKFPYGAFIKPLENIAHRIRSMSADEAAAILVERGKVLAGICPSFHQIEVVKSQAEPAPLDPGQEKIRKFDAVKSLFMILARRQPLVLVLEDLQWADDLSLELFHYICRSLSREMSESRVPFMMIASCRSEFIRAGESLTRITKSISKMPHVTDILLSNLPKDIVGELVCALLGEGDTHPALIDAVFQDSGGNPLFVYEIVRSLLEGEHLIRSDGYWRLDLEKSADSLPALTFEGLMSSIVSLPDRIQELISQRLDNLGKETRMVLSRAAVLGQQFEFELLLGVAESDEDTLLDFIDEVLREDILEEVAGSGGERYRFKHHMIRNVLLQSLHNRRKTRIHRKAGQIIETLYASDIESYFQRLGYHFDRAGVNVRAIDYYLKSVSQLFNYSVRSAEDYADRVIELMDETDLEPDQSLEFRSEAMSLRGRIHQKRGRTEDALTDFGVMRDLGVKSNDPSIEAMAMENMAGIFQDQGRYNEAIALYEKCLSLLPDDKSHRYARTNVMAGQALVLINQGKYRESRTIYRETREIMVELDRKPGIAMCDMNIGLTHYYLGEYSAALELMNRAIFQYKAINYQNHAVRILINLAGIHLAVGNIPEAMTAVRDSLDISRKNVDPFSIGLCQTNLAVIYQEQGNFKLAEESMVEAIQISERMGDLPGIISNKVNYGTLFTSLGEYKKAESILSEAVTLSEEIGDTVAQVAALLETGVLFIQLRRYSDAEKVLLDCKNAAEKIGFKAMIISARAGLTWITAISGDADGACREAELNLKDAIESGETECVLRCRYHLSGIYLLQKQYQSARIMAARGLKVAQERHSWNYKWLFRARIAGCLKAENRLAAAVRVYRSVMNMLTEIHGSLDESRVTRFNRTSQVSRILLEINDLAEQCGLPDLAEKANLFNLE